MAPWSMYRVIGVPDRLPQAIETVVYRIVQEALTNMLETRGGRRRQRAAGRIPRPPV